ncbi:DUF6417 family protein [Streptomyces sp. NPDC093260]|uniref:DUF6417 family protein n=1 Tax=Streptomyces sp. NPDC093260 TaxID=3155073 RepID=UPI00344563C6
MEDDDLFVLQELALAPARATARRLAALTLEEAHDLLRLLLTVPGDGEPLSDEAGRLAKEIAARVPSQN